MSLFTHTQLREVGENELLRSRQARAVFGAVTAKNFSSAIDESNESVSRQREFDIFLCHSKLDEKEIFGLRVALTKLGFSVYVDWIDDKQLDRTKVDKKTAETLRIRMGQSRSLLYATSDNAETSVWMPWELGYFDALKEKVAIVPVAHTSSTDEFQGREYCELYPYIVLTNSKTLYVHRSIGTYINFASWLSGSSI